MIDQVKRLLQERQLMRAVIIDDAYDDHPRASDLESQHWDRFWADITDADEALVAAAYGPEEYERQTVSELNREQLFVDSLWNQRAAVRAARILFEDFESTQDRKRTELLPLRTILETDLGMTCHTLGRDEAPEGDADFVFLDLFLGFQEIDDAVDRAIERIKGVVDQRRAAPPIVVLLSRSPRLEETGPRLRDYARLLGCQFRMLKKSDLVERDEVLERIHELALSRPDSLKLNAFLLAWEAAIDGGKETFLRSIRRLDLSDYANLGELVLKAEREPLGDYVLDLYDLHFHSVLEGNEALVRTARALNDIGLASYPPPQFMPSPETDDMMDGALFENEIRTRVEVEVEDLGPRLGDVFLAPSAPPPQAGDSPSTPTPRYAYVVLSQACDLQHRSPEQILVIRGAVKPYSASHHVKPHQRRTPVMKDGDVKYSVEWDVFAPETWRVDSIRAKRDEGYRRIRRFRTPSALQLQQAFLGNMGRVGTLTHAPARYPAGIKVFLRTRSGAARLLADSHADSNEAVCLVGREENGDLKEWLLLSPTLQRRVRQSLQEVPADELPTQGGPVLLASVINDLNFYRCLKEGLKIKRATNGSKPFSDSTAAAYDVLQIISAPRFEAGGAIETSFRPVVFQLELL